MSPPRSPHTTKSTSKTRRSAPGGQEPKAQRDASKKTSDARLYGGIAALVLVLGALVWWSLPGPNTPVPEDDEARPDDPRDEEDDGGARPRTSDRWERPGRAASEFAVVTDRPDDVVQRLAARSEIAARLAPRHCGPACDAVKKFLDDEDGFELEIEKTEEVILPPKDTMDTVAPGLTPAERDHVFASPTAIMVRAQGAATPEQVPARAAFAVASLLAEELGGFVYDETSRRIETAPDFTSHTITAKLGEPAFSPRQIVVQLYRDEAGAARLVTLGMQRYGAPDLVVRGASMASGASLSHVVNAVASQIAHGMNGTTTTITREDVARVMGKKPTDLSPSKGADARIELELTAGDRVEGDPDNDLAELAPKGGPTPEAWDDVVTRLFGGPPSVAIPANDKELDEIAKKARRTLPDAIRRFQAGQGELFVKAPFPIPEDERPDGGPATELLWVATSSCDTYACTGVLTNDPTWATNLAAGRVTGVRREEAVDWLLHLKDGGAAGGESIAVLQARARPR